MNAIALTRHAGERLQQRAIPGFVLHLLEACGSVHPCNGAEHLVFDKAALARLRRHLGGERNMRILEPWLDVYAVLGERGRYVTAGRRFKRMRRD